MFVTWRCTVCSLTTRRAATWRSVMPSATSASTSRSRGVRVGGAVSDADEAACALDLQQRAPAGAGARARARPRAGRLVLPQRVEARRELDACGRALVRRAACGEAVDCILEQRARAPWSPSAHGPCRRADPQRPAAAESRSQRRRISARRAQCGRRRVAHGRPGLDEELEHRDAVEPPLYAVWRRTRSTRSAARDGSPESSAIRARQSCSAWDCPACSSRATASSRRPCRRRSSARPTSGPRPTPAGSWSSPRSRPSSRASALVQRPRLSSTAPYSARQNASMYRLP